MAPPLDLQILRWVNQAGSPILDPVMVAASNRWLLLGIAVAGALYVAVRSPHHWLAALMLLASIGAADLVAVRAVKPAVERARPCHSLPSVRAPDGCGSGRSFPSAHASDTAAAATIVAWAAPALSPFALALTAIVGLSRVYLGVHYPSDVVGGWVLGAAVGAVLITIARLRYAVRIQ
ncbi:MAG TPA: phosphatase PAP2 family protein [Myxococcales bacterium]|nr:phosphatase PAP2 family protein [Myxococcales bacterium]